MQKNLYILRHAKAEALASGQDDHARALSDRGMQEAVSMGKYLFSHGTKPQKVLCSTATRTRETWQQIQEVFPQTMPIQYEDRLYHAPASDMLRLIAEVPEHVASLMIVGHNPGLHELSMRLARDGDGRQRQQMAARFPTCSFVELEFEGNWRDITTAEVTLRRFMTPDGL